MRLLSGASPGRIGLELKGAAAGESATSGGRLVGTSDGKRATSSLETLAAAERAEVGALGLAVFVAALGFAGTPALRRASGSGAGGGFEGSDARASTRGAATAEGSGAAGLAGAEMLMLGSATTAAELAAGALGDAKLGPGGGAPTGFEELAPNEKAERGF